MNRNSALFVEAFQLLLTKYKAFYFNMGINLAPGRKAHRGKNYTGENLDTIQKTPHGWFVLILAKNDLYLK